MSGLRHIILKQLYNIRPFSLSGDARITQSSSLSISCIIPTYDRWQELDTILYCLSMQDFPKERYEVIVIEDGATEEGRACCSRYEARMQIRLLQAEGARHHVGSLRNRALERSLGEYLLFLDDDTIIHQTNFFTELLAQFTMHPEDGCVQITGNPDRCLIPERYSYLDRYSFATRCVAYRRKALAEIGGFIDSLKSYEDIELAIRYTLVGGSAHQAHQLSYYHPPLYFVTLDKAITNGLSFLTLRQRYSSLVWLVCYLNACRFVPLLFSPRAEHRQWGIISAGFILAPISNLFARTDIFYR